jgi:hypothetical protein
MINLSQLARESPDYPLLRKIKSALKPDIYLADDVLDYQENAPKLEFPAYKRFPFASKFMDRAYIIINNVGIKKYSYNQVTLPDWFIIHDDSAQEVAYWNANDKLFPTITSFEQLQESQGLKDDDYVSEVFLEFLIQNHMSSIVEVNKYIHYDNPKKEKRNYLSEIINGLIPEFNAGLRPAF